MEILDEDVVIAGAGIAGLATAVALKRVGVRALVLERSDGLRTTGAALSLFPNAWLALDALGVSHKLDSIYAPLKKGFITNVATGATQEVSFTGTTGKRCGPRSLHRKALLEALAQELPIDTIRFSSKLAIIETQPQEGSSITILHLEDGTTIKAKILIGCDGVHSVVARRFGLAEPVDSDESAVRGLAVFPQGHGLLQEVHQFTNIGKRAGFVPLNDNEVYWFMIYETPYKGTTNPEVIQKEVIENHAKGFPSEYLNVVGHADLSTLSWAPLKFRYPWNIILSNLSQENMTLAGDAMHPMTPHLAQGGGSALEDAVVLGRHIGKSFIENGRKLVMKDTARAIEGYVKERRWRVAALILGSYFSGWAQQSGSNWWKKLLRDVIFYRFLFSWIVNLVDYDCGELPIVSSSYAELDNSKKVD